MASSTSGSAPPAGDALDRNMLAQHRCNAAHAALLDGPGTALWLMTKPAWSATCSLAGALRFERRRWGEQLSDSKAHMLEQFRVFPHIA